MDDTLFLFSLFNKYFSSNFTFGLLLNTLFIIHNFRICFFNLISILFFKIFNQVIIINILFLYCFIIIILKFHSHNSIYPLL